jgi:hypothetical protein
VKTEKILHKRGSLAWVGSNKLSGKKVKKKVTLAVSIRASLKQQD